MCCCWHSDTSSKASDLSVPAASPAQTLLEGIHPTHTHTHGRRALSCWAGRTHTTPFCSASQHTHHPSEIKSIVYISKHETLKNRKAGFNRGSTLLNIKLQKVYVNKVGDGDQGSAWRWAMISTQRRLSLCLSAGISRPRDRSHAGWTQRAPSAESWLCSLWL